MGSWTAQTKPTQWPQVQGRKRKTIQAKGKLYSNRYSKFMSPPGMEPNFRLKGGKTYVKKILDL